VVRKSWIVPVVAALAAAACTPATATTTDPVAPKIQSFVAAGGPFTAPAVVPLVWKVTDANGGPLTCRLDREDDGTYDETISNCGNQSRDVSVGEGAYAARLEVSDGDFPPVTSVVSFTVGAATTSEPFDITLRPLSSMQPAVAAAFDEAAARWEGIITTGIPDEPIHLAAGDCLSSEPGLDTTVDDVLITVEVVPIDGAGQVLGQAGPCIVSSSDSLTREGIMQFDSADVSNMLADGTFVDVVLHEMGHVLGIGTLWDFGRDLVSGVGGSDPRYTGPRGVAEWSQLGGSSTLPVENTGGSGTAGAHWRELTFADELMTGWIASGPNPLSAMTIASLGDLGYHVDRSAADPYALPIPGVRSRSSAAVDTGRMLRPPISVQ
jgi:hypothetical protein